jgi:cellulose synthase operon protein C
MSNSPSKTLSPAELAKLEHAFASDPASDAYRALAEAYLGMGRFMEAMVVCKKGVKAHPTLSEPRVLLARVYAEQGKDKKALEELAQALQVAPEDKHVLRMVGGLQMKTGELEPGKASLLKAFAADPADPQTAAALKQWNVQPPVAAPPPAAAAPAPVPAAAPAAAQAHPGAAPAPIAPAASPLSAPVQGLVSTSAPAQVAAPARAQGTSAARSAARPAPRPAPRVYEPDPDLDDDEDELPRPRARRAAAGKGAGTSKLLFLGLLVAVPMVSAGYYFVGQYRAKQAREVKKHLTEAADQLKHDSYASYKLACDAANKALEVDSDSAAAHGYLAYAWAIRWGEHGGGDEARSRAEEHLKEGLSSKDLSSHVLAAEALVKTYSGKNQEALRELAVQVKRLDEENKRSSLLQLTLGIIQMNAGDLEGARESLEKAQGLAPTDPRVYAAMGSLYRRRGQDSEAWKQFDFALRYEKNHPESMLGRALLMLEQEDARLYVGAAKQIKALVDSEPPPSPRQLAMSHLARSFLISRVSNEVGYYKADFQKELLDGTGVPADKNAAQAELTKAEQLGFGLDRQNPELHLIKGRRLFLEGQMDDAVAEIRTAIKMDPTRAQFYVELARALMTRRGGEKEAEQSLVTALKTMGHSPKLVLMLGHALQRQGKSDEALKQFILAVGDGKARAPEARLALGSLYREKKDFARAQENLEKAAQEFIGQPSQIASAYTELGRVLDEKGDRVKAEEVFVRALNADTEFADAYYHYARFLAQDRATAGKARLTAQEYLKRAPRGEFVSDAQRLAQ